MNDMSVNKSTGWSMKCSVRLENCDVKPPYLLTCLNSFCGNCIDVRRSSVADENSSSSSSVRDVTECPACVAEKSRREPDAAGYGSTESAGAGVIQIGDGIDADLGGCGLREADGIFDGGGGSVSPTSSATCEVCGHLTGNVARVLCVECRQKLCGTCSVSCWKWKGGPPHQLFRLEGALVSRDQQKEYCARDGLAANVTDECKASDIYGRRSMHRPDFGNKTSTVPCADARAIQFLEHVRREADALCEVAVETRQRRARLDAVRQNLLETTAAEQETIKRKGEQIKNWIDERVNVMLARIDALRNREVKEIDVMSAGMEHTAIALETFVGYTKQAVDGGAVLQFGAAAAELFESRIAELKRMVGVHDGPYSVPDVRFVAAEDVLEEKMDECVKLLLGELCVGEEMESRVGQRILSETDNCYEAPENGVSTTAAATTCPPTRHTDIADVSSPVPNSLPSDPFLQSTLTTISCVRGVAECADKLYVVCDQSDIIFSFELHTFDPSTNVRVAGLNQPKDLVACSATKHLYIAENGCVWRVAMDTGDATKWLTDVVSMTTRIYPFALSVTSQQQVLLTTGSDELLLYGSDGEQLKCITSPELNGLRHAVETPQGTFFVINLWPQPQVSEVDIEGRVLRVYNDQQTLNYPCRLELAADGRVFVADFINHRVLLLSRHLELERVLLDADRHRLAGYPLRMCYQRGSDQLIVASGLHSVVQVFSIN